MQSGHYARKRRAYATAVLGGGKVVYKVTMLRGDWEVMCKVSGVCMVVPRIGR